MADLYVMSRAGAAQRGFPANPQPGQVVRDERGVAWAWFDSPNRGLYGFDDDGLGFWGALVGLGTSLFGSLFGGGKAKKQAQELQRTVEEQQKLIEKQERTIEKQQKEASRALLTKGDIKNYGPTLVLIALAGWMIFKK